MLALTAEKINCTSQTPQSSMLQPLSPTSISPSGHIKVLSTLQIADAAHPSIYACGDVIGAETPCPNARSAMHQATVVARNILRVVGGKAPKHEYKHHWIETFIKLTLGLVPKSHAAANSTRILSISLLANNRLAGPVGNLHGRRG